MRPLRVLPALLAAAVLAPLTALAAPTPAAAACAGNSGKSISGTVFGQDGRDVNVSIGIDLVDRNGRAINAGTPGSSGYGCAKTGGYSQPQQYLNHFVGPEGQPQASPMKDAQGNPRGTTTRAWSIRNVPSNAVGAYIEVYHRGYQGSPCKDSRGNWCFNKPVHTKYGDVNKHLVPVGTSNLPIRLPMTCAYKGTAGAMSGRLVNSAGRTVVPKNVYVWTEHKWNQAPFMQGWGIAKIASDGTWSVPALASRQTYVAWAYLPDGRVAKKFKIKVNDCATTRLTWRV